MAESNPSGGGSSTATDEPETKTYGDKGQAKRFLVRLTVPEGEDAVDTTKFGVSVKVPVKPPAWFKAVAFHQEDDDVYPPGNPTSYLQIWELDKFDPGEQLANAETDSNPAENRLVASIPGAVVRADGKWEFRMMGKPVPTRTKEILNGRLTIELKDAKKGEKHDVVIDLPEYEGVLEMAAILAPSAGDTALADVTNYSGITFVHNVHATVRRQLKERDGITVAFVPDHDPSNKQDKQLFIQAGEAISTLPSLIKNDDGELRFGYYKIKGHTEIPAKIDEVLATIKEKLDPPPEEELKVGCIVLYGHGTRTKLKLNPDGYDESGSLNVDNALDFVSSISDKCSKHVVLTLFSCNNGRGFAAGNTRALVQEGPQDKSYGRALACDLPGYGSLAHRLHTGLVKDSLICNTVWAHTTSGHPTRNPYIRVFSMWGTADLISVFFQNRRIKPATIKNYLSRFQFDFQNQKKQAALTFLANGNRLRTLCLQNAVYLPWKWNGGYDPAPILNGFNENAYQQAKQAFEAVQELIPPSDDNVEREEFKYFVDEKGDHHRYITALSGKGDPKEPKRLSTNLKWSEFARRLGKPPRISVSLLQGVQIVRAESGKSFIPFDVQEGGKALVVSVNKNAIDDVVKAAEKVAFEYEMLSSVTKLGDNKVLMNDASSPIQYSSDGEWIKKDFSGDKSKAAALVTASIRYGQLAQGDNSRAVIWAAQRVIDASRGTAVFLTSQNTSVVLGLDEDSDPAALETALQLEAGGEIQDVQYIESERLLKLSMEERAAPAPSLAVIEQALEDDNHILYCKLNSWPEEVAKAYMRRKKSAKEMNEDAVGVASPTEGSGDTTKLEDWKKYWSTLRRW